MAGRIAPTGTSVEEIARALASFITVNIMARGHEIQPDDDLAAAGIDSMALLKVLLFVEAEFGFWMPEEDLRQEHLASPRALARYICRRRGSAP